ncbi:M23 family metallopeptidase [Paraferrimonas haliotis]|uniref:M23 family metallopeptidase n=1 Tax=Paraferrimonas haliotis TaxID=2013866 RepID=UPI000BA919AB|nr:peptidoglycan DD-metalloendopeptidase family protein [Paraferrimonas haliotis]
MRNLKLFASIAAIAFVMVFGTLVYAFNLFPTDNAPKGVKGKKNEQLAIGFSHDPLKGGFSASATNLTTQPMQLQLEFVEPTSTHYQINWTEPSNLGLIYIAPNQNKQLATLIRQSTPDKKYSFRVRSSFAANTDNDWVNRFPLPIKSEAKVIQSPTKPKFSITNFRYRSHSGFNQNAIDFLVPTGTPVYSIRSGRVAYVKEDSDFGCPDKSCVKWGNIVSILHHDGTLASYSHLKFNSVIPVEGQIVEQGELLAFSGATGGGGLPHLHLQLEAIEHADNGKQQLITVEPLFIDQNGSTIPIIQGTWLASRR